MDMPRVGSVEPDQVVGLIGGRADEQVRLLRDLAFDSNPQRRLGLGAAGERAVLDQAERVRGVRPGHAHVWSEQARDLARQPVVRVEHVVAQVLALGKGSDPGRKSWDLPVEGVLVQAASGGQINDAREGRKRLDRGVVG
jgi:hypothetical protein